MLFVIVLNIISSLLFHYRSEFFGSENRGVGNTLDSTPSYHSGRSFHRSIFLYLDKKMPIRTRNDAGIAECK